MDPRTNYAIALKDPAGYGAQDTRIRGAAGDYAKGLVQKFIDAGYTVEDLMSGRRPFIDPNTGHTDPAAIDSVAELAKKATGVAAIGARSGAVGAGGGKLKIPSKKVEPALEEPLFDYEAMKSEKPFGKQRDLPYGTGKQTQRVLDVTSDPKVRRLLLEGLERAQKKGGGRFYTTQQLREHFRSELGKEQGDHWYDIFLKFQGATSPQTRVPGNIKLGSYYYQQLKGKGRLPEAGNENYPPGYGSQFAKTHQNLVRGAIEGTTDPAVTPKTPRFSEDLSGNWTPYTVDVHDFRQPGMLAEDPRFLTTRYESTNAPKRNIRKEVESGQLPMEEALKTPGFWDTRPDPATEYPTMARFGQDVAKEAGLAPAVAQDMRWGEFGDLTGLQSEGHEPWLMTLEGNVNRTAKQHGVEPIKVIRDFIRGKIPLLGAGGVAITLDQLSDKERQALGVPPAGGDWAAGLKEGEVY